MKILEIEKEIFDLWQDEDIYSFDPANINSERPLFTIDTPPPYTNASWHMGSTVHYLTIDMVARMQRMRGHTVNFPMGLDRNGLPIEIAAEKQFNVNMHEIPREEFLKLCQQILDEMGDRVLNLCYKIGMSCNSFKWDFVYRTDDPQYRALTQATFIDLWHKGKIYEDDRPNNWDYNLKTTIADAEIEYKDGSHVLYDIEFQVKETSETFSISTSRPELIPAIRVIVYHPSDTRYTHLENKTAVVPLWNIKVPIQAHPIADPEFGSGIMQICSFGDISDVRVIRELGLDAVYAIDINGKLTDVTGKFEGLSITEGKKAIIADLKQLGVVTNEQEVPHRYPISERSNTPIEFIGMPEYYLKQEEFVEILKDYSQTMKFYPESMREIWKDWLDKISMDWPISRRRFYGTEVPIWYCTSCQHPQVPEPGPYYQPWRGNPPFDCCEKCGQTEFRGDERTFDTWMDSSVSPLYIAQYPNNSRDDSLLDHSLDRPYLADLRPQGKDIVRTWLHYTMLRIYQLYSKPAFDHAWISGHVVNEDGTKMSKRDETNVPPEPIVEQYGGDALRLFAAMEASHGSDVRFSEDRLKGGSKFLNKLYNIAKFINFNEYPELDGPITETDKWILGELKSVRDKAMEGYARFDPHPAAQALRNFAQETFSSHYMEMIKNRSYNRDNLFSDEESASAIYTLYIVLDGILRLFAPIIPFITDYIYRKVFGKSVHTQLFPDLEKYDITTSKTTELLLSFNSALWSFKHDNSLSLRDGLYSVEIPTDLSDFSQDLMGMHNNSILNPPENENGETLNLDENITIQVYLRKAG